MSLYIRNWEQIRNQKITKLKKKLLYKIHAISILINVLHYIAIQKLLYN